MITAARNLRADMKADPKMALGGKLYIRGKAYPVALANADTIHKLANVTLEYIDGSAPSLKSAAMRSTSEFDLLLEIPAAQAEVQRKRLEKEQEQLRKVIASSERQLNDEKFLGPAPDARGSRHRFHPEQAGRVRIAVRQESRRAGGARGVMHPEIEDALSRALAEDIGAGDVTSEACIPAGADGAPAGISRASRRFWRASGCWKRFSGCGAGWIRFEPLKRDGGPRRRWRGDRTGARVAHGRCSSASASR